METGYCQCGCGGLAPIAKESGKGYRKGESKRYIAGHHPHGFVKGHPSTRPKKHLGYKEYGDRQAHRLRAERALGKPLPPFAVVHHADGSKDEDAPLVICENQAYHMLLHARIRVRDAGGNPNTDCRCGTCGVVKPAEYFNRSKYGLHGRHSRCRACERVRSSKRLQPGSKPRGKIRSDCGVL